jgi:hypothetical protein
MAGADIKGSSQADAVEESLKSARSVHLVLFASCAAVALFAASPRQIDKYVKAREELEALRAIDLGELVGYENELIIRHTSSVEWLKPSNLFPGGYITASMRPEDLFPITYDAPAAKTLPNEGTIEDWLKFFDSKHPVSIVIPNPKDQAFREFLQALADFAKTKPKPELQSFSFKSEETDRSLRLPAYAVCGEDQNRLGTVFDKNVSGEDTLISTDAFRPWLSSAESVRPLRKISPSTGPWLDNLRSVRNEISGLKLAEVARYFEGRVISVDRKINVLGATIDEPLAIVGGPVAVLLPLIYLLLLCWHVARFPLRTLTAVSGYPWIVLFPGWHGAAVRAVSAALPIAVCIWLFWSSYGSASLGASYTSLAILVIIAASAFVAWRQFTTLSARFGERTRG